jgi:hypothetical protein
MTQMPRHDFAIIIDRWRLSAASSPLRLAGAAFSFATRDGYLLKYVERFSRPL